MQTLKVTNIGASPTFVHTVSGPKPLERGASIEADFNDGEARNIADNKAVFQVQGYTTPVAPDGSFVSSGGAGGPGKLDGNGDTPGEAALRKRFDAAYAEVRTDLADARKQLQGIADLFGEDSGVTTDNLHEKVADLISQVAAFDGDGNGHTGGSGSGEKKPTLAEAVASLDDKNDAHWTQGGKPDLEVLKGLTGADVKRAEVDALDPQRVRASA